MQKNADPATDRLGTDLSLEAPGEDDRFDQYLNRELTWLEFNRRVLHEALDPRTPLLDRVRFHGIFTSNRDEFYMKRVGGLKRQIATGIVSRSQDGRTAKQQLAAIRELVVPMLQQQARSFRDDIMPALEAEGVQLLRWKDLTPEERREADTYFRNEVFPVLTPLAVDPGHPFPFISNLSQSLAVVLRHKDRDEKLFARVKVPQLLPRWVQLFSDARADNADGRYRFVRLQEIIRHNLADLFPDMELVKVMPFRVTRNADIEREEEDAEDLLEMMEEELRARRFARVVRLEHEPNPDPWVLDFLIEELELHPDDVYELPGELDYTDLAPVADLPLARLHCEAHTPVVPPAFADDEADIFNLIRRSDILVHHPYESFAHSVERFIKVAADDPRVLAIKMTLYRTGDESPFINTLVRAAESGKQVACLVEVKARFDEQRNIRVAQMLEKAGVHVVYGVLGLKTHTKTALVVRRDPDGLRSYCHIGTGNYHAGTSRLYTDLGLFTAKPAFTQDVVELFHYLTGRSLKRDYDKLLVAPVNMRARFLHMIDREIAHQRAGRPARIIGKMNALEDRHIIRALYRAAQAGVKIDLIVRGFCTLRPGVEGLSENIRVISVIGRFLEHSRIYYFRNGTETAPDGQFFIGSADWMSRNLVNRVEAIAPIEDRPLRERLWHLLDTMLNDQRQAWDMQPDGTYTQRSPDDPAKQVGTHLRLIEDAQRRAREAKDMPHPARA